MLARYRHAQLLAALALLLVVRPFLGGFAGAALVDFLMLLTLASAIVACSTRRRHIVVGIALAGGMQIALLVRRLNGIEVADVAMSLLALGFFGYVIVLVLASVFRDSRSVSADTICGALSVYLLVGLAWSFAYSLLEIAVPGSFSGIEQGVGFTPYERFIGYSFVTMTTLGYGNVYPLTPRADALAMSEAIAGQIYLAVLVARLVALNLVNNRNINPEGN